MDRLLAARVELVPGLWSKERREAANAHDERQREKAELVASWRGAWIALEDEGDLAFFLQVVASCARRRRPVVSSVLARCRSPLMSDHLLAIDDRAGRGAALGVRGRRILLEMTSVVGHLLRVLLREQVFEVVQLALEHLILGTQSRIIKLQFVILLDDPVVGVLEDVRFGLLLGPRLFGRLSVL